MSVSVDFAFLDSGTGGIPYMLSLHEKFPSAFSVYLGDTEHFPYGEKSGDEITSCASRTIEKIIRLWNPKSIVIACNTISVTALAALRERFFSVSIIGTVPAIKLASEISKNRRIGLLATNATINHPYCKKLIGEFAGDCEVFNRADSELIDFIEKKYFTASEDERLSAVRDAADFFKGKGCDTVILGCTHFTHIAEEMRKACGDGIAVVDSRDGVSNQAIRKFHEDDKISEKIREVSDSLKNLTFFVTKASGRELSEYKTLCANLNIPFGGII